MDNVVFFMQVYIYDLRMTVYHQNECENEAKIIPAVCQQKHD